MIFMKRLVWPVLCLMPLGLLAQDPKDQIPLIDSPLAAQPIGVVDKLEYHAKRVVDPGFFLAAGAAAGFQQLYNKPPEWGQGAAGYGRRYGSAFGANVAREVVGFGLDSLLHEDPRFFRLGRGDFMARSGSALVQVAVTHTDSGGRSLAVWRIGGAFGAGFISNAWRPPSQNKASDAMVFGGLALAYDGARNIFMEFWPDIKRKLLKK